MKKPTLVLLFLVSCLASAAALAQARVRGTITGLHGDVLMVKSRDGREIQLQLAPDAQVSIPKKTTLAHFKPGSYVGVTSVKRSDGRLLAKRVHALPPQVPSGQMPWDSIPNSTMTNAHLSNVAHMSGGSELTLEYKNGEQKVLVTPETEYITFEPGSRTDLRPGETIFSIARVESDGKFSTQRVTVSKNGVKPPQ